MQSHRVLRPVPPARSHNISRVVHAVKGFIPGWHGRLAAESNRRARSCGRRRREGHDGRICHHAYPRGSELIWEYEPATIKEAVADSGARPDFARMTRTAFPAAAIQSWRPFLVHSRISH